MSHGLCNQTSSEEDRRSYSISTGRSGKVSLFTIIPAFGLGTTWTNSSAPPSSKAVLVISIEKVIPWRVESILEIRTQNAAEENERSAQKRSADTHGDRIQGSGRVNYLRQQRDRERWRNV